MATENLWSENVRLRKLKCMYFFVLQMRGQGVSVKDVNQHEFVKAFAAFLKKWELFCLLEILIIVKIYLLMLEKPQVCKCLHVYQKSCF